MSAITYPVRRVLFIVLAVVMAHALALWVFKRSMVTRAPADVFVQVPVLQPVSARLVPVQPAGLTPSVTPTPQPAPTARKQNARPAEASKVQANAMPVQSGAAVAGASPPPSALQPAAPAPAVAVTLASRDSALGLANTAGPTALAGGSDANSSNASASAGVAKSVAAPIGRFERPSSDADYLRNPRPEYPHLSRQRGEQGRVVVNVFIGIDGSAQKAEIISTSGFDRLDQAALATVRAWRYQPGKRGGVPEAMWFAVPIQFVLQ